jgi:acetylornithine deacetylase
MIVRRSGSDAAPLGPSLHQFQIETEMNFDTLDILARLVAFRSVSAKSNLDIAGYIETYCQSFGGVSRRTQSVDGSKTNVFVSFGPMVEGGILLSGHMDVVPVESQIWDSDPFMLIQRGDRVYGRGTTDMKGFLAVCLALIPMIARAPLKRPLHLAFSYDEEVGCLGVPSMIDDIVANVPKPFAVIVGEPTGMQLVTAHKGAYDFRTIVTGRDAHSSIPDRGSHSVFAAARLIDFLGNRARRLHAAADPRSPYDPPYSTLTVGVVMGGTAGNIIPKRCTFEWEMRPLRRNEPKDLLGDFNQFAKEIVLPNLTDTAPDASIVTSSLASVPPLIAEPGSPAEALVRRHSASGEPGAMSFCTEAGQFQAAGFSSVVCGPGKIDQAHQANEFVEIDQLRRCERLLASVTSELTH